MIENKAAILAQFIHIKTPTFLYILYDPTHISTTYYVGMSCSPESRLSGHIRDDDNIYKKRWIEKLQKRNVLPHMFLITAFPCENTAGEAEKELIAFLWSIDVKLANIAEGGNKPPTLQGEENGSFKLTNKQVEEIRDMFLYQNKTQLEISKLFNSSLTNICDIVNYKTRKYGIDITPELLQLVTDRCAEDKKKKYEELPEPWNKGKIMTEEYCLNNSLSHVGIKPSAENLRKRSLAMKGRMPKNIDLLHSPEVVAKRALLLQGEGNGFAKLKSADVLEIRKLYATGSYTQTEIGNMYKVGFTTISNITRRKSWKHI